MEHKELVARLRKTYPRDSGYAENATKAADVIEQQAREKDELLRVSINLSHEVATLKVECERLQKSLTNALVLLRQNNLLKDAP